MQKVLCFGLLAMSVLCLSSAVRASDDQCPCVQAARQIGASKDDINKITKLRDEAVAALKKIAATSEYKAVASELEKAKKAGDKDALASAQTKIKEFQKPAWEAFHKGAKDVLGKEAYAKYVEKLPDWVKV